MDEAAERRVERSASWPPHERQAFWRFVRGRMAELGLRHSDVAPALHMERSVLSKRLSGEIRERPSQEMVASLARILALTPAEHERLLALSGHRRPAGAAAESDGDGITGDGASRPAGPQPSASRQPRLAPAVVLAAGAALLAVAVTAGAIVAGRRSGNAAPSAAAGRATAPAATALPPGGLWLSPADGDTVHGPITFAARAYPAGPTDPAIAMVLFTVSWPGRPGPWLIACRVAAPAAADRYECRRDPAAAGVPAGPLRISFDVYDRSTPVPRVHLAPHGTRTISYAPDGQ